MSHSPVPDPESAKPSEEEARLLAQLRANPIFAARFQVLMDRFDEEVAAGMDANEAEEMVIANVKGLAPATGSAPPIQVEVYRRPPNPTRIG